LWNADENRSLTCASRLLLLSLPLAEMNGQEMPLGPATITDGALATSFTAYQPRTFALKLAAPTGNPGFGQV